jgi:hypothetical protein
MGSKTLVIAAALTVIGSALLIGAVGTAVADVPVGPGPTNYSVQPQPAPGTCQYRTAANGQTLLVADPGAVGCRPPASQGRLGNRERSLDRGPLTMVGRRG